jgi:hypothetical protein
MCRNKPKQCLQGGRGRGGFRFYHGSNLHPKDCQNEWMGEFSIYSFLIIENLVIKKFHGLLLVFMHNYHMHKVSSHAYNFYYDNWDACNWMFKTFSTQSPQIHSFTLGR